MQCLFYVYHWDINCILNRYTLYILNIFRVYTRLGGWSCAGGQGPIPQAPPAITSPGRVITYFAKLLRTLRILALVDVDAQGASGTKNSRKVPSLTGNTCKPIFLDLHHSRAGLWRGPNDKDNQTNLQEEGVAAGTRDKISYQEYTRYIPGIFKVYTKCRPVDKLLNPVAGLAPEAFYSTAAL